MRLLACDIGSTNLKLQMFTIDSRGSSPRPNGASRIVDHGQAWLKADNPLEALSSWLNETAELITRDYTDKVETIGFSTYREGVIGLSSANEVVFAGTNLQPTPLGTIEKVSTFTTFAGWMGWKLSGRCHVTAGQVDAGTAYVKRVSSLIPCWTPMVLAGENIQTQDTFGVYLGGTDEQLGYVGTGLIGPTGPQLVIATGTFWSISRVAAGPRRDGVRRTEGVSPFQTVDSCVFYKWGPMIKELAENHDRNFGSELVPTRFFGDASELWFTDKASPATVRQAVVKDLKAAYAMFSPKKGSRVVVYGGGVQLDYARDLIIEASGEIDLVFMDGDATLRGCAMIGGMSS